MAPALIGDAGAAIRGGGGFRFGGHIGHAGHFGYFGRSRYPYSYVALSYSPYGYGAIGPRVTSVSVTGGSGAQGAVAPPPALSLTCKHSQEIVTVPMEDGSGTQQIRITRC
jgi:hypothetical protein